MPYEFKMKRHVEFAETDMAGIMHFANYFRYMEVVEHAFFRSLGLSVHQSSVEGMNGFARVHASCDYHAPLRYQDEGHRAHEGEPLRRRYRAITIRVRL